MSADCCKPGRCGNCGTDLPANAAEALCPKCLLERALAPGESADSHATLRLEASIPFSPFTGTRLQYLGDYELLEEVARGGMGIVFKARQVSLNRLVAVKLITSGTLANEDLIKRFKAEAEAAASLSHPNIVPIHEIGEYQGQHYFSMGLIDGLNLDQYLSTRRRRCKESLGPSTDPVVLTARSASPHVAFYNPREAAATILTLARAVHYAHQHGVLHRDIKPGNILIDKSGTPFLTDFGLAKIAQKESTLTHTNAILGTPSYMAPEQARGETKNVTTAADVYGLGAVLYTCLTGEPPFAGGTTFETIRRVLETDPRPPSSLNPKVDRDLETICLKCLEKDPARRYSSASSLAADLERWQRGEPIAARPATSLERAQKWVRRRPVIAALTASLILALLIGATAVAREWQRAEDNANRLREHLYAANLGLASQASDAGHINRARQLLEANRPSKDADLRGFEWRYLYGVTRPEELAIFKGTNLGVWGSAIDPKDRFAAAGHENGIIEIWDLKTHSLAAPPMRASTGIVYSVAFSPDGRFLASTMADAIESHTVHVWDMQTFSLRETLRGHSEMTMGVAFSPDGKLLASTTGWAYDAQPKREAETFIWDVSSGRKVHEFVGHNSSVGWSSGFSPDGQRFVTAHGDGAVRIWDVNSESVVQILYGHETVVLCAKFSPDGKYVASGDVQGNIRLWDLSDPRSGTVVGRNDGAVITLAFSPNGKLLVSGSLDQTAKIWSLGQLRPPKVLGGHSDRVWSVSLSSDGQRVLTGSADATARLWSVSSPDQAQSNHTPEGSGVVFSQDGHWLVRDVSGKIGFWNRATTNESFTLPPAPYQGNDLAGEDTSHYCVCGLLVCPIHGGNDHSRWRAYDFIPGSDQFVSVSPTRGFSLWRITEREPILLRELSSRTNLIAPLRFARNGQWMALRGGLKDMIIWDTTSWREVATLHADDAPVISYEFAQNDKLFIVSYEDGRIRLWNTAGWQKGRLITAHSRRVHALAASPDGRWLATGSFDANLRLYDLSNDQSYQLRNHNGGISALAFSPDSKTLAVGGINGEVKLWSVSVRREMVTFKAQYTMVNQVIFAPDNDLLVSCGDPSMRFWSAPKLEDTDPAEEHAHAGSPYE